MGFQSVGVVILVIFGFIILYFLGSYITLWIQALVSGAKVSFFNIVFMRLRKVPPKLIVNAKIMAVKAGLDITTNDLESHYLAGGDVMRVVQSLIAADKANIELKFNRAAAIERTRIAERQIAGTHAASVAFQERPGCRDHDRALGTQGRRHV